jgi:plastocyanin
MKKVTALLAIGSLALAACGSSSSSSSNTGTAAKTTAAVGGGYGGGSNSTSTKTTAAVSNTSGNTISVGMSNYRFTPKVISGKPGATITVKLTNSSSTEHNFKIDGQPKADADVPPGKSGTAIVKIPASGTVQFYCEYHKGLGMVGTVKAS